MVAVPCGLLKPSVSLGCKVKKYETYTKLWDNRSIVYKGDFVGLEHTRDSDVAYQAQCWPGEVSSRD
jgi:hypothetical protein